MCRGARPAAADSEAFDGFGDGNDATGAQDTEAAALAALIAELAGSGADSESDVRALPSAAADAAASAAVDAVPDATAAAAPKAETFGRFSEADAVAAGGLVADAAVDTKRDDAHGGAAGTSAAAVSDEPRSTPLNEHDAVDAVSQGSADDGETFEGFDDADADADTVLIPQSPLATATPVSFLFVDMGRTAAESHLKANGSAGSYLLRARGSSGSSFAYSSMGKDGDRFVHSKVAYSDCVTIVARPVWRPKNALSLPSPQHTRTLTHTTATNTTIATAWGKLLFHPGGTCPR